MVLASSSVRHCNTGDISHTCSVLGQPTASERQGAHVLLHLLVIAGTPTACFAIGEIAAVTADAAYERVNHLLVRPPFKHGLS
jgi:hypothetical protein